MKDLIIPFNQLRIEDVGKVGGKNASLGEMVQQLQPLGIQIPNGFAVTADAFRFFLEEIKINNSDNSSADDCERYKFEYINPEALPDRFSYETDLLGFFNGNANTTLISENQNILFDETFQNLAVRETNFEFATKGILSKIHYPTGGYNEFEYENPKVLAVKDVSKSLRIYRNKSEYTPSLKASHFFNIGGELPSDPSEPILTNPINQTLYVTVNATVIPNGAYHHHKIIVEVENLTTSTIQSDYINLFTGTYDYSKILAFTLIKNNNYRVKLRFDNLNPTYQDASIEAYAIANYKGQEFFSTLGLRVKSIKAFDENNQVKEHKRLFYKKFQHIQSNIDESAVVTFDSGHKFESWLYCCMETDISNSFEVVSLTANPLAYYLNDGDNQVSYRYVTTSLGGDYFENGGIEKHFKIDEPVDTKQFLYGPFIQDGYNINFGSNNLSNKNQYNGVLLAEKVLKKDEANNLVVQSETKYNYETTIENEIKSFIAKRATLDGVCLIPQSEFVDTPAIGYYSNYSFSNKLISTETSLFDEQNSNSGGMSKLTEYEYGILHGLATKITTKDSKGNTQITEYKYPTDADIATMPFGTSYSAAYTTLKNNNIVSVPIEAIQKYKYANGTEKLVSKAATLFRQEGSFIVPEKTLHAKANESYEGNIENSLFDDKGNLLEITQENIFKKSYIYGYNDRIVIAELANIAYNSIPTATINTLKNLSNNVIDETSMTALKIALNQLQTNLPDAIITTFVYDKYKLLRITTDSRGRSIYQDYDECKRLKMIRDNDLNIIQEYQYNLNQN